MSLEMSREDVIEVRGIERSMRGEHSWEKKRRLAVYVRCKREPLGDAVVALEKS